MIVGPCGSGKVRFLRANKLQAIYFVIFERQDT